MPKSILLNPSNLAAELLGLSMGYTRMIVPNIRVRVTLMIHRCEISPLNSQVTSPGQRDWTSIGWGVIPNDRTTNTRANTL